MPDINWLAVLTAALSAFLLGGLWYSPAMFLKAWQRGAGLTDEQLQKGGHPGKIYGGAFVLSLVAAATFAMFLGKLPVGHGDRLRPLRGTLLGRRELRHQLPVRAQEPRALSRERRLPHASSSRSTA